MNNQMGIVAARSAKDYSIQTCSAERERLRSDYLLANWLDTGSPRTSMAMVEHARNHAFK